MLYFQFLANVMLQGVQDYIVPFPNTSLIAARWFLREGIQADLVNVDGSHDEADVYQDLLYYWRILKPGGVIIGDDYHSDWMGVVEAVNRFAQVNSIKLITSGVRWMLQKAPPLQATGPETSSLTDWMSKGI